MVRVLVTGGRRFDNERRLTEVLNEIDTRMGITTIIHGAARGADALADLWARTHNCGVVAFPAKWDQHGRSAGPIRNREMLNRGQPDFVVAFLYPGGEVGAGTRNMCDQAVAAGLQVIYVHS